MDFGQDGYTEKYRERFSQHEDLILIGAFIVALKQDYKQFRSGIGHIIRQAYDEVIDMPRTRRWSLSNLASTEKTYIGTKVEILVQHWLGLERGVKLDLRIHGHDVDVKNTVSGNWMIPTEAVNEICLLISGDEPSARFSVGLIRASEAYLNAGKNKDGKRSISKKNGFGSIYWLVYEAELPKNFFYELEGTARDGILAETSGAARVRELFRRIPLTIVPRSAIEGVANQKDALKRVRGNGGAREALLPEGLLILSGKYDAKLIRELDLPPMTNEQYISVPRTYIVEHLGEQLAAQLFSIS